MKNNLIVVLVAGLALVAGVLLAVNLAGQSGPELRYMQQYPQPRALPDFKLTDQHQQVFDKSRLQDHWTLTFVGYTFCPDICPTTMAELNRIYPQLADIDSDNPIQVLFLSVDPARDTPQRLNDYVGFFNSEFIGATAEHAQLFPLVRAMGMMYSISDSTDNPNYLVDHSASVVVIDPNAQVVGRFRPELSPGELAVSDVEQIAADMPALVSSR